MIFLFLRQSSLRFSRRNTLYKVKYFWFPVNTPAYLEFSTMLLSEHVISIILALSKQISIRNVYCWSDSLIALWWIKQNHKTWKLWILNRVKKIGENVNIEHWNYVNNPADVATRRTSPNFLVKNLLRWNGPFWRVMRKFGWQ